MPESTTATSELVVPRSMPMIFPTAKTCHAQDNAARQFTTHLNHLAKRIARYGVGLRWPSATFAGDAPGFSSDYCHAVADGLRQLRATDAFVSRCMERGNTQKAAELANVQVYDRAIPVTA